jgi:hypothetical protein
MTSMAIVPNSRAPLDGLSIEGTIEFEMLDALPALDDMGKPAWTFEGGPIARRKKRWLELYMKQMRAMRLDRNAIAIRPAFTSRSNNRTAIGEPAARAPTCGSYILAIIRRSERAPAPD